VGFEVIKPAGFGGADEVGECGVEAVEGFIQQRALAGFCCWSLRVPCFIVLESVFDDERFSHKIRGNGIKNCPQPIHAKTLLTIPPPAPGTALTCVARSWGQGWPHAPRRAGPCPRRGRRHTAKAG